MSSEPALRESGAARWSRRSGALAGYALAWLTALAVVPLALPFLALLDWRAQANGSRMRLALFGVVFLSYELFGVLASLALWLARPLLSDDAWLGAHRRLQALWAGGLFRAAARIFRLRLEVEGAAAVEPGPLIVLIRHVSLADTLLPAVVLAERHGLRLRYVLKRELLLDPCLDIVGQRLPNTFVRRGSGATGPELAAIASLARGLGPRDGVLIYPEGTRFDPVKRERALAKLESAGRSELAASARELTSVLPPHTGGALTLLEAAPGADVLVFAHAGLEGLARVSDLLAGHLVGRAIRVGLWRVPRAAIPRERAERERWLFAEWARVDAWVKAAQ
jgi:1-acyl-sn-glycerol-3-phosphate acyltransferase